MAYAILEFHHSQLSKIKKNKHQLDTKNECKYVAYAGLIVMEIM